MGLLLSWVLDFEYLKNSLALPCHHGGRWEDGPGPEKVGGWEWSWLGERPSRGWPGLNQHTAAGPGSAGDRQALSEKFPWITAIAPSVWKWTRSLALSFNSRLPCRPETFQRARSRGCKERPVVLQPLAPTVSLFIQSSKNRFYENVTVVRWGHPECKPSADSSNKEPGPYL